jgi:recombination associated protein RdgC
MWFRNLQIYRLPVPWAMNLAALEEQLSRGPFLPCPSNELVSRGWISPRGDGALIHALNGQWLVALAVEQRLLPSSVINQVAQERAEEMEAQQGYKPGRKQMKELRERVAEELMPRAFTQKRRTFVWIDPAAGWLCIDAASPAKAEEVIEHLRWSLDDFPLALVKTQLSPTSAMADWLASGEGPAGFTIDRDCELKAVGEEKAAVTYKRHPLEGNDVKDHLASGKLPTRMALTWNDRISFILTEKLEIRRLTFPDLLKEEAEQNAEVAAEQFDADFALMTGELARFLPAILEALGGEVKDLAEQGGGESAPLRKSGDWDADYQAAVAVVKNSGRASISLVQRHLRIGYNYAARLIEAMEKDGTVSAMDGKGNREVLAVTA